MQRQAGGATGGLNAKEASTATASKTESQDVGLGANCLSDEDGGGLALPGGAAGHVYRLDAMAFNRDCALPARNASAAVVITLESQ